MSRIMNTLCLGQALEIRIKSILGFYNNINLSVLYQQNNEYRPCCNSGVFVYSRFSYFIHRRDDIDHEDRF